MYYEIWARCACEVSRAQSSTSITLARSKLEQNRSGEVSVCFKNCLLNVMDIERLTTAVEQEYHRLKEVKKREADDEVKV
jgi:hypothetical protein